MEFSFFSGEFKSRNLCVISNERDLCFSSKLHFAYLFCIHLMSGSLEIQDYNDSEKQ